MRLAGNSCELVLHRTRSDGQAFKFVSRPLNFVNGTEGISDIEGKAATGSGERAGMRASFKLVPQLVYIREIRVSIPVT
jgi:hypothetical protein